MHAVLVEGIFRADRGKIVERWDVVQDEMPTSETVSGNPMIWRHEGARQYAQAAHDFGDAWDRGRVARC
ncbi:hypothetical protein [Streptomyces mirabilis]|uniref:hypothetical protein n=1 Tax=Streptomyces mirabilis TaxID=68239 RepID=UPI0036D7DC6A